MWGDYIKMVKITISYNVPSIYNVATEGSNVPKGKGEARSVYAVLGEVAPSPPKISFL